MNLCKYRYIFGKPGQGVHQYQIFGIAIVDTVMTIFAAIILAYFFKWNFIKTLVILFIIGEIFHYIFCVPTAVIKFLFPGQY